MEGADALGLIAEVGIAIAGFAGIIATYRAPGGRIGRYAAMRIGMLLGQSGAVVVLALLPFALYFAGLSRRAIWAVSSSTMVLVGMSVLVTLRLSKAAVPVAEEDRAPGAKFALVSSVALITGNIALQLANLGSFTSSGPSMSACWR